MDHTRLKRRMEGGEEEQEASREKHGRTSAGDKIDLGYR